MKTKELRIGNYIFDEYRNVIVASGTHTNCIWTDDKYKYLGLPIDKSNPIPLSKEWLLKMGFSIEFKHTVTEYTLNHIKIFCPTKTGSFYIQIFATILYIKSVHQLQNLYFALTNEELKLK